MILTENPMKLFRKSIDLNCLIWGKESNSIDLHLFFQMFKEVVRKPIAITVLIVRVIVMIESISTLLSLQLLPKIHIHIHVYIYIYIIYIYIYISTYT